ncbi:TRAP transporter small permease [Elioraea sp.]|uniref:TRAP transporter small permease n=1 Tax=Elioraea sp. TaxID=2185103 RepID=UPI003F70B05B
MAALAGARSVLERILVAFCVLQTALLALLVCAAVVLRKLGAPLIWYDEIASIQLAWLTYYGAALAALHRAHLGVPSIVAALPRGPRLALLIGGEALVIGFFALVAWFGLQVIVILEGDTLISLPWVPVSFTQSVIPVGAVLFVVAELLTFPERLGEAWRGEASVDPERYFEERRP